MKNKQGGTWDNLYPITLTENVFDKTGKKIEDILSEMVTKTEKNEQDRVIADIEQKINNMKSQKGSNQHGHWIKRADGTMTTWTTFELEGEPDGKWGELFYWQPSPANIEFPQSFIEIPTIQYTQNGSQFIWSQSATRHQAEGVTGSRGSDFAVPPVTVTLKATGRWSEAVDGNFFKGSDLPNYWRSHLTSKIDVIEERQNKHEDNFSFIFITDLHMDSNAGNSFALVQILLEETEIENVVIGGDLVENPTVTPKSRVLRQMKEVVDGISPYWERVMGVIGNHDDNTNSKSWAETLMPSEQYEAMMKQMGGSVVFGGNKTYYYKDDTLNKVRYIGLNSMDFPFTRVGNGLKYLSMHTFAYSQAQISWLANTALRTPSNDWTIVVASHTPPYKGEILAYDYPTHNEELVRGLVKAYKDKGSYSGSSKSETPSDIIANISADYSNGGGDVAVWLSGHVHYDNAVVTPEGIPLVTTLNDGSRRWLDAPVRTPGTIREQALDVITVNKNERKLYFTRIGAGADRVINY